MNRPRDELVYGFIERSAPGITVSDHWDVLGMRASQSRATILDQVPMRPERVSRIIPAGRAPRPAHLRDHEQLPAAHRLRLCGSRRPRSGTRCGRAQQAEVSEGRHRFRRGARDPRLASPTPTSTYMPVPAMLDAYTQGLRRPGRSRCRVAAAARGSTDQIRPMRLVTCTETALMCTSGSGFGNSTNSPASTEMRRRTVPPAERRCRPPHVRGGSARRLRRLDD